MLDSKIIKIHVGEEVEMTDVGLFVKFLSFNRTIGGKEYEEFGDKHELEFEFKKGNEIIMRMYGWFDNTPNKYRIISVFDCKIMHLKDSTDVFEKKDDKGEWIKLVAFASNPEIEHNYQKLREHYLKKDYNSTTP